MLLQINKGEKSFGGDVIFSDIQFEVKGNEKIALIGRNGCGKTTLLKIISGSLALDKGEMIKQNKLEIGYLSQRAFDDDSITVRQEFAKTFAPVLELKNQLDQTAAEMALHGDDDQLLKRYSILQQRFEACNGYNYDQEQQMLFTRFGFAQTDLDRPLSTFSGGQKTRIAFVSLLLSKPGLLLLDEPTNHLDMETIIWLEGYLKKYPAAIVVASHDRMFMDHIIDEVYAFDDDGLKLYHGNYSAYLAARQNELLRQQSAYRRQQADIARLEELIEKFRYKKNKAAFAQSKIKYLDRMTLVDKPKTNTRNFKLHFAPEVRGGNNVLDVRQLVIGYDQPLCTIDLQVKKGNKIGIIGPNGLGKSTFLKTLMGQVSPLVGDYMFGHQIQIGYFDQQLAAYNSGKTVLDELWDDYPELDHTAVRKVLGNFMFTADDVQKSVNVLSGGEKVRFTLARLMLEKDNLLLLDEPTNHLDIPGKEVLEKALQEYDGTVMLVSHDRWFIQQVANAILVIDGKSTQYYPLTYQEYVDKTNGVITAVSVAAAGKPKTVNTSSAAASQRYNAKQSAALEKKIAKAEEQLEQLRALRYEPEYYQDFTKMNELNESIDDKHNEIAHLMKEWEDYASQL